MITLEISPRHLAWWNQRFFSLFDEMPDEVFSLRSAENEWSVGELLEDEEIAKPVIIYSCSSPLLSKY